MTSPRKVSIESERWDFDFIDIENAKEWKPATKPVEITRQTSGTENRMGKSPSPREMKATTRDMLLRIKGSEIDMLQLQESLNSPVHRSASIDYPDNQIPRSCTIDGIFDMDN
mmetsp:Transcript_11510/g.11531  ORF Transcript_11510/g.11531 Transcript_11510/m.11531 type:complete len:113 (+) Transcript_11510:195-533(+)|eukprot:CAMPEP_0182420122 /NCGR_PEP_ID=MMETSP1167-20130531/4667_1 /TAXON_ID=2988 /ORGANISM="Mallomonas Sp, Strain CCMP3275" /LENGTH=112 /DNA_ID=CAMNT_0024595619 /DNA_START=189 /DNA_END=530 /DNA_ORIENTATION=-